MTISEKSRYDVAIIGSGFAGSILACILSRQGMRVALIDAATHPRFAIGESSTPIADMLLRRLGAQYGIDELVELSTWGSWQNSHPELGCGRKRGFTYFVHPRGEPFSESSVGQRSVWVAASKSDPVADTHWYRPEVDEFLFQLALVSGATDLSGHAVRAIENHPDHWTMVVCEGQQRVAVKTEWVIDASGQSGVLARMSDVPSQVSELRTKSYSSFAHFRGVKKMSDWLASHGYDPSHPFDADDAAQHHLLPDGWIWMLRMNNGITSVGITSPKPPTLNWSSYPTLCDLMSDATTVTPVVSAGRRLQRWFDPVVGPRQLMLPTAALTLDPLHSTGIAHALAGVDRVARIVSEDLESRRQYRLKSYRESLRRETRLLDGLVSTAYATMHDFPRFTLACMLYFAAAITCEERYPKGQDSDAFSLWNADDDQFAGVVDWASRQLMQPGKVSEDAIRERLQPWNTAGLIDPAVANRYAYTAAAK